MSIFKKLMTAIRGGATEMGEAIADSQALRIMEQEIREADEQLRSAKDHITTIMAKGKLAKSDLIALDSRISQYESHLATLLNKEDASTPLTTQENELKNELAEKIAELEQDRSEKSAQVQEWADAETKTLHSIKQTEQRINKVKQRAESVKATDKVHRARASLAAQHSGTQSSLSTALDSLNRIESKQREQSHRFDAAEELERKTSGSDLDEKLKAAGLTHVPNSAASVIERMRAKKI